ncbi:hypothetical protein [Pseudorhodoplanes sinuspersici]|uniref:Uncharacterized protein n=1 Tax=Pseudorhodoplanes sinuspersici TaxID=1235591 RepID=A0A1W6ZV02_9HYPH|nr:hypothetical protein [Pseudorhodoplanes sinuspersici]ARQ01160.1 hypothetical protein CAK95_20200 [Pseudorhodoplanes sinuspersici]RKE72813.1 hypothetical protein DFP91_0686 [Pseudorhodoplanes sinuspersici]
MIAPAHALTLLANDLEPGERVIYAVRPDIWTTIRNKIFLLWIGVPWCIAIFGLFLAGRTTWGIFIPLAMIGLAMLAAPIILAIETQYTIYAITDRRALIVRTGLRPSTVSCPFNRMDEKLEIMSAGGESGHLYFASNMSTKMRDVDYTGKLAFRDLADVQTAAAQLEAARKRQ